LLNSAQGYEDVLFGSGGIDPHILNLGDILR